MSPDHFLPPAFHIHGNGGPLVAVALHAGHAVRPEVARALALSSSERRLPVLCLCRMPPPCHVIVRRAVDVEGVIESLERKIEHKATNGGSVNDTTLATL